MIMNIVFLIGRILAGGYFIYAGIHHYLDLAMLTGYSKMKGVPLADIAVPATGLLLLIAGFSFLLGYKPVLGIAAAVLFLIPVTIMMHAFWAEAGDARIRDLGNFTKNLALLGSALMFLMIPRPWPIGLEKKKT
jgi:putative oxidoreductase